MADMMLTDQSSFARRGWSAARRLGVASLVWLLAVATAAIVASIRGLGLETTGPLALAAAAPAVVTLLLAPALRREWVQLLIIFAWLALAIVACLVIAFIPMAMLFLCAPAAAALFDREKVVEAMVLAAIFAALLYYAGPVKDAVPDAGLSDAGARWGVQAGVVATVMFLITAMFGAASRGAPDRASPRLDNYSRADILAAVSGPVLMIDRTDNVDYASREAMDVFGISSDFGVMPATALLNSDPEARDSLRELIQSARKGGHRRIRSIDARGRDSDIHRLEVAATPLSGPGNEGRVLLQAQDLTDRAAQMEARRRERAVDEAPDRSLFDAGVAHELRTPLNAIIGFSDMMRSRMFGPLPGRYAEYADLIHDSGQHMLDLIGDVLDLSRVEAGRYQLNYDIFDAGDVVRSSVKMVRPMADTAEVALILDVPEDDVLLEADRKAVRQILLNILSNAIKFSPRGGQIEIALQAFDEDVVISVEDEGPGMSAEEIARIGEPFVQGASAQLTEERGSGLGLALVSSLAALHEGSLEIESDPEDGTLVSVTLPRKRAL